MIRVIQIPADSTKRMSLESSSGELEDFQLRVGGFIECVNLPELGGHDLWLNEEGKLHHLDVNLRATRLMHIGLGGEGRCLDVVMGDAFLTGPPDENGAATSIHNDVLPMFGLQ